MSTKLISPVAHGIIDYAFGVIQMGLPALMGLPKKARNAYAVSGAAMTLVNAITDTPVGLKDIITMKEHQKADLGFLAGMGLMTASRIVRSNTRTTVFHLAFLGTAILHYILTDYNNDDSSYNTSLSEAL